MVSETGLNLDFIINYNNNYIDDWKSFALWYSIKYNAPDADIYVCNSNIYLFNWNKNINIKKYKFNKNKLITLDCDYIMLRPLDEYCLNYINNNDNLNINDIKVDLNQDEIGSFSNYEDGFGSFHIHEWKDKKGHPFNICDKFMFDNININQIKILQLWQQMAGFYNELNISKN